MSKWNCVPIRCAQGKRANLNLAVSTAFFTSPSQPLFYLQNLPPLSFSCFFVFSEEHNPRRQRGMNFLVQQANIFLKNSQNAWKPTNGDSPFCLVCSELSYKTQSKMMACQLLYFIVSLYRQSFFLPGVTSSLKTKVIGNSRMEKDFDLRFFLFVIFLWVLLN